MISNKAVEDFADKHKDAKDGLLGLARTAEAAERYSDMCIFMKKLVKQKCETGARLVIDERNLLSVAYKNVVGVKRNSWRELDKTMQDVANDEAKNAMYIAYKLQVEQELKGICKEVIGLLGPALSDDTSNMMKYGESTLLSTLDTTAPEGSKGETEVFYLKMVGDYCRYLAEIDDEPAKKFTVAYYEKAMKTATDELAETHPTRLGLALNYSVCYYEIMKDPKNACELAKKAFDGAIEKLDTLNDASYKDSTLIMQLLRDNLTLWTSGAKF